MTKKELEDLQRLAKDCKEAKHVPRWVSFRLERILEDLGVVSPPVSQCNEEKE